MSFTKHIINSPDELEAWIMQLTKEDEPTTKHHLHLAIFSLLAHKETLEQCRDHNSRYSKDSEGRRCGITDYEYLNITSLAQAWRRHWKTLPTARLSHVTLDMTLPVPDEGVEQVKWDHGSSQRAGIKIHPPAMASQTLINTMVLEMHMRSKGSVKMDVVCAEKGRPPSVGMIKSFIEALETGGKSSRKKTLKERSRP